MIKTINLDNTISEYYDNEMNENELLNYEAKLAISKGIREYTNKICFEYYKISTSLKRIKEKSKNKADKLTDKILNKAILKKKKLLNINSILFQCFNKRFRRMFLHFLRNNTK